MEILFKSSLLLCTCVVKTNIFRLAKKTMFKVAFHGGMSNMWSGLMTVPEVTHTNSVPQPVSMLTPRLVRSSSA